MPVGWQDRVDRWMRTKQLGGCVPRTLDRYRHTVERLLRAMARAGRATDPASWTVEDGLWVKAFLRAERWSLTVVSDFARSFGSNAVREAGIPAKAAPIHVQWLSRDQVAAIVGAVRSDPLLGFVAFLGLGQGLRRVEWQRLRCADVDLPGRRLLVRGKGRSRPKLQWVAMHPEFPAAFGAWSRERERLVARARRLHPECPVPQELLLHAAPRGLAPYSLSGLDLLVHRIELRARARGSTAHLSSHMFRRSGATLLEEALLESPAASVDGVYRVVQGFLRHENLATTMRYLESSPRRQRRALVRFAQAVPWYRGRRS